MPKDRKFLGNPLQFQPQLTQNRANFSNFGSKVYKKGQTWALFTQVFQSKGQNWHITFEKGAFLTFCRRKSPFSPHFVGETFNLCPLFAVKHITRLHFCRRKDLNSPRFESISLEITSPLGEFRIISNSCFSKLPLLYNFDNFSNFLSKWPQ